VSEAGGLQENVLSAKRQATREIQGGKDAMYYAQLIRFHTDSPFALSRDVQVRRIREILPKEVLEVRGHELRLRAPNGQWKLNTRGLDWAFVVDKTEPTDSAKADKEFRRMGHRLVWALCCLKTVAGFSMGMGCMHSERACWLESPFTPWGLERPIVKVTGAHSPGCP
jgi:hypothetical protein